MKKTILSLAWLLLATVSSSKAAVTNVPETTHHSAELSLQCNIASLHNSAKEHYSIDTTGNDDRALPESKPKKHGFAKVILGLPATFFVVFVFVARSGNFMRIR